MEIFNIIKFSVDRGTHNDQLVVILFFFINFFLFNFIIISVISLIIFIFKTIRENKIKALSDKYQNMLAEYIFYEGVETEKINDFREVKDDKLKRAVLISQILNFNKNLYGEAKTKLQKLFAELELNKDAVRNLNSGRWHIQALGMRQLAQMNITEVNTKIEEKINSNNDILSFEAQLAMIELNQNEPFAFLSKLQKYFPLWNQLNAHMLVHMNNLKVPEFANWLRSENSNVAVFALRMISVFQQQKAFSDVVLLLNSSDENIRKNAIITLGKIGLTEALINLKNIYPDENIKNKILILKAMQNLPDESSIMFLGDVLMDNNNDVKLEAAKALLSLGDIGRNKLQFTRLTAEVENADIVSVIDHTLDTRII